MTSSCQIEPFLKPSSVILFENSESRCKIVSKGLDLQGHNDVDIAIGSKDPNNPIVGFERYDYV